MASDVVPELLDEIQKDFDRQFRSNSIVIDIYGKIRSRVATYKEANEFSIQCGEMLARSIKKYVTADVLPEGRMWYNIATRILTPTLRNNYSLITDVTNAAQSIFNEKNGIGFKPITPAFNTNRLNGLIDKVSNAENYDDVAWVMDEPIVNFSQSIVDQAIKDNADFQYKSGMTPKIRRTAEPFQQKTTTRKNKNGTTYLVHYTVPCAWCKKLEGVYNYPYIPTDVYRKHEGCRCTCEYISVDKRESVWDHQPIGEPTPAQKEKEAARQLKQQQTAARRLAEQNAVRELMRQHPDWSEAGATKYYRTHLASKA